MRPHGLSQEEQGSSVLHCFLGLLKLMSIESVMLSNHLILCCSLLLCLQSFTASRSFLMSRLFASGGQSIGTSALASVLAMNIHGWFPLKLTSLISLQSKGLSRVFFSTAVKSINSWCSAFFMVPLSLPYMATGNTIALTVRTFVSKMMFLLFNMLSMFVIAFLPRDRHLLISRLQSFSTVILEPRKIKSVPANISMSCNFNQEVRLPRVASYSKKLQNSWGGFMKFNSLEISLIFILTTYSMYKIKRLYNGNNRLHLCTFMAWSMKAEQ